MAAINTVETKQVITQLPDGTSICIQRTGWAGIYCVIQEGLGEDGNTIKCEAKLMNFGTLQTTFGWEVANAALNHL